MLTGTVTGTWADDTGTPLRGTVTGTLMVAEVTDGTTVWTPQPPVTGTLDVNGTLGTGLIVLGCSTALQPATFEWEFSFAFTTAGGVAAPVREITTQVQAGQTLNLASLTVPPTVGSI